MNRIVLTRGNKSWNATFYGPHADNILGLFGTRTLPLPFAVNALPETVLQEIELNNPHCSVEIN